MEEGKVKSHLEGERGRLTSWCFNIIETAKLKLLSCKKKENRKWNNRLTDRTTDQPTDRPTDSYQKPIFNLLRERAISVTCYYWQITDDVVVVAVVVVTSAVAIGDAVTIKTNYIFDCLVIELFSKEFHFESNHWRRWSQHQQLHDLHSQIKSLKRNLSLAVDKAVVTQISHWKVGYSDHTNTEKKKQNNWK